MKLLLDENIPKKLKRDLLDFNVFTVQDMGWSGKQNGKLLNLLVYHGFEALLPLIKTFKISRISKNTPFLC